MTIYEQLKQFEHELETPQEVLKQLTPIQFAAKHGELKFIEEQLSTKDLSDRQRILNQQTLQGGFTALHYAAYFGHTSCVQTLLALGASLDSVTQLQMKPIQLALISNTNDRAKKIQLFALLNNDPMILRHPNKNGDTVAHIAAEFDLHEILMLIKEQAGENLNIKNQQGLTPLLVSLLNNSTNAIRLLSRTPSVMESDYQGRNALHYATLYTPASCLADLVSYCTNNTRDLNGLLAVDYARQRKSTEKINILTAAFPSSALTLKSS